MPFFSPLQRSRMSIGEDLAATDECKVYSCEHEEEDSEGDQIKEEKDFLAFCVYQYLVSVILKDRFFNQII